VAGQGKTETRVLYRWDLDKTYLRTEFDTVRDLVRTAFERASRKQTVPGAASLLRELRATSPAGIYVLSGSPEQMRRVVEAKLRLDGVHWDALQLKPSLHQLVRGRFRFLRDQVGYKLGALLASRATVDPDVDEVLFGDDAEGDAFIYSLYSDLCAGRVSEDTLAEVLRQARIYDDDAAHVLGLFRQLAGRPVVRRVFIHLDRVSSPEAFEEFGRRVCPFYNYFQPALVLVEDGELEGDAALRVGAQIVIEHGFSPDALTASFMDLARRRYVGPTTAQRLLEAMGEDGSSVGAPPLGARAAVESFAADLRARAAELEEPLPPDPPEVDYVRVFSEDRARVHQAKRRARWGR
jgi:hypothetical protein